MEDRNDGTIFINGEPHVFVWKDVHLTPEQSAIQEAVYRKLLSGEQIIINRPRNNYNLLHKMSESGALRLLFPEKPASSTTFWTRVKGWFWK